MCIRSSLRFLVVVALSGLVPASLASAQIDASLFGDNLGPAIFDLPDSGDDWLVVEDPAPAGSPPGNVPAPPGEPSGLDASAPALVPPAVGLPAKAGETGASGSGIESENPDPATERKRSWLKWPWKSKSREREEYLASERAKNGPKLGGLRSGAVQGVAGVDDGLLPSELRRWQRDPRKAMDQAREERKLLLLWMTDSLRSSTSKTQAIEVFRHTQFLRMARDYMVLTKIDFAEADIASHKYTRYLKERLKVNGYPALILFSPDSEEVWRFRGYRRGRFPTIIDALRFQVKTHALKERDRYEKFVTRGYRDWTNDRNQGVFAKALAVSPEERTVLFVDDQGRQYRYPVVRLSGEDRAWLAEKFLR